MSTASLVIGVAASAASRSMVLVAELAGLVAGAMSMATGEYVSVSSQRDAERADIARQRGELAANPDLELGELAAIYQRRGLDEELARTVAGKLMAVDPLAAHVRDELGLSEELMARPVQAAVVSAVSFAVGAVLPLVAVALTPAPARILAVAGAALVVLGVLGLVGGRLGGASPWRGAGRVLAGGGLGMAATAVIGRLVGAVGLQALVWRDGGQQRLDVRDLVPDDVVALRVGDLVPADLRLLEANQRECDEAVLTGEPIPAVKSAAAVPAGG